MNLWAHIQPQLGFETTGLCWPGILRCHQQMTVKGGEGIRGANHKRFASSHTWGVCDSLCLPSPFPKWPQLPISHQNHSVMHQDGLHLLLEGRGQVVAVLCMWDSGGGTQVVRLGGGRRETTWRNYQAAAWLLAYPNPHNVEFSLSSTLADGKKLSHHQPQVWETFLFPLFLSQPPHLPTWNANRGEYPITSFPHAC